MNLVVFIWRFLIEQWLAMKSACLGGYFRSGCLQSIGFGYSPLTGVWAGAVWRNAALTGRVAAVEVGSAATGGICVAQAMRMRARLWPWASGDWLPIGLVSGYGARSPSGRSAFVASRCRSKSSSPALRRASGRLKSDR
jgi:hypothetical protein